MPPGRIHVSGNLENRLSALPDKGFRGVQDIRRCLPVLAPHCAFPDHSHVPLVLL